MLLLNSLAIPLIIKNSNEALILPPNLAHKLHPYPSQSFNGPSQPDQLEHNKPSPKEPPDDFYESKQELKPPDDTVEPMRLSKPPEVAVEPKSPDDSFSFESEPPTISFQRPILLSLSPAERPTETTYSAITKNSNEALILSPNLVHNLHPFPSQLFNGLTQPDQQEPDNKVPPTNSVEPKPPSKPPDDSHVSKPPTKLSEDILQFAALAI